MTREDAKRAAEVMLAYAKGKEVECRLSLTNDWIWTDIPKFNWGQADYRIKKEPVYRPFKNREECWNEMQKHQSLGWVIGVKATLYITEVNCEGIGFRDSSSLYPYKLAFETFKFADGTPFGIKEE